MTDMKKKIVIFSGAGISKESGLPTFRGEDGLWESIDVDKVADYKAWYCGRRSDCRQRRQAVLDFIHAKTGQVIVPALYDQIEMVSDKLYKAEDLNDRTYVLIDLEGRIIQERRK